jgi:methionyl aminopeptidase
MVKLKTNDEIETMKKSCRLAAAVLTFIEPHVKAGVTCLELNDLCHDFIVKNKAIPSPLNYKGYPKSICTSVNQVVCHGIPDKYVLKEGDIVNVDITTFFEGFHGDTSKTYGVGKTSRAARDLMQASLDSLWLGIRAIQKTGYTGDIGEAIQKHVEGKGFSIVREYCGHGIGRGFHEDPAITHYGKKGTGTAIAPGMVFTIEPMVNLGSPQIELLDDDWTVVTRDGKLSAQFEHTVAIRENGVEILTLQEGSTDPSFLPFR